MKLRTYFFIAFLHIITISVGQTTLPTSWDFATTPSTLPTGWSTNTTESYTSGLPDLSGGTSRAGKLQSTNHHFTIHFFDEPGTVSYNLRAYSSNGSDFLGVFEVEESVNGTSWTTLASYTDNDFGNSWSNFTATPNTDSRYIRFLFTTKVSGVNVGLDDVSIAVNNPTEQEINVQYSGADVPSGTAISFASSVGSPLSIKLGIQNLGSVDNLIISSAGLSGSAAGDFNIFSLPSVVEPLSTDTLEITFNAGANGSRQATLSIQNNDGNENPYIIEMNGIGGTGASEPNANPSILLVETLKTYRVKATFTGSDAENYLVLFRKNADFTDLPQDGVSYELGEAVGNAKVAKVGSTTEFWLKEATAKDTFYVKVFGFNGEGSFTNYRTSDPLVAPIVTPERTIQLESYYDGVSTTNPNFISQLHNTINPHTVRFYSAYGPQMIPRLVERDTIGGQKVVTGVYSNEKVVFSPPFGWSETNMNREHTLPSSWMPSSGNTSTPEYQDYHHLFPTVATANGQRSNHPLGNVVNIVSSYGEGKRGTDIHGNTVYEPYSGQKGDAARAIFYMITAYHNPYGGYSWALLDLNTQGPDQRLDVLLQWHMEDLPSGFEIARNDYLDSLQGNRNPFIDNPHWACYINFRIMAYIGAPDSACLQATLPKITEPVDTSDTSGVGYYHLNPQTDWAYYPNPAENQLFLAHQSFGSFEASIYDSMGNLAMRQTLSTASWVDIAPLASGLYTVRLTKDANQPHTFKLVKR